MGKFSGAVAGFGSRWDAVIWMAAGMRGGLCHIVDNSFGMRSVVRYNVNSTGAKPPAL